jgi:hypothetical protein
MHALVFRQGPLPVSPSFLKLLFESVCPDVMRDSARIHAIPLKKWPDDISLMARSYLFRLQNEGKLDVDLETGPPNYEVTPVEKDGIKACLVVVRAPQALSEKTLDMMERHVARVKQPQTKRLLEQDCVSRTLGAVAVAQHAFRLGKRYADAKKFDDVALLISVVQATDVPTARAYFRGAYMESINYLANAIDAPLGEIAIAHWVFMLDKRLHGVHLSYLPAWLAGAGKSAVLAQDLMGDEERTEWLGPAST